MTLAHPRSKKVAVAMDRFSLITWLRQDRGAVLVEAAIAIPILLLVILGSLEFGVAWEAKSSTTNGQRSGLLRAATLANEPQTDLRTLQSIIGEVGGDNADRISWVVIFEVDPTVGDIETIVNNCAATVPGTTLSGGHSYCTAYGTQTLINIANTTNAAMFQTSNFDDGSHLNAAGTAYDCDAVPGLLDENFCAGSRTVNGDIEIGVAFEYQHEWLTGILPFSSPAFREVQTTSTFAVDGTQITSNASLGVTTVENGPLDFASGGGSTHTFENGVQAFGPYGGASVAGVTTVDSETITVQNLASHDEICLSFDLIIGGWWEPTEDILEIDINGDGIPDRTVDPVTNGSTSAAARTIPVDFGCFPHTGAAGSSFSFNITSTSDNLGERWGIDNVEVSSVDGFS